MDRGVAVLADTGRLYRELFEHAPELVAVLEPDGTVVDVNPRVEAVTGYSHDEICGRRFDFLVDDASLAESNAVFASLVGKETPQSVTEAVVRRRDGSPVALLANGWPVLDGDDVVGVLAIAWEESARETSSLAHELNNLLAVIAGNAELALRCADEPERQRLEAIITAARRGAQLARKLLARSAH